MSDRPTVHVSSLAGWHDCPRRSATRTFRDQIIAAGYALRDRGQIVSAAIGTGVHAGARHILTERLETRTARLEDAIGQAIGAYHESTSDGCDFDTTSDGHNTAEQQIARMTRAYYHGIAPNINPVAIERRLTADAPGGLTVTGQPDVTECSAVRDLKTGKNGQSYHAQLGGYSLLTKAADRAAEASGEPHRESRPDTAVIDWLPRVSIKKTQPEPVAYTYPAALCETEAKAVLTEVARQWGAFARIHEPSAFPANSMSILCSPKYCTAYGTDWCPVSKTYRS